VKFVKTTNQKHTTMEPHFTSQDDFQHVDSDFENIIRINNADDEDLQDFDFDYDPNEMYYALANEKN